MASIDYLPVSGSEKTPLQGAYRVGPANPNEMVEVAFFVRGPSIKPILREIASRRVREREHLTRAAFIARYGANRADLAKVERFASRHNLSIVTISAAQRYVLAVGSAADMAKAFQVQLATYRYPGGTYRGRTGTVQLPAELSKIVRGVFGLDNRPQSRVHLRKLQRAAPPKHYDPGGGWYRAAPANGYSPVDIAKLYNFPSGTTGQGQRIAILEFGGGFRQEDINTYFQGLGLPAPTIGTVVIGNARNSPTNPNSADSEVMLDIEVAGAVAPGANIVVYFAPNTNLGWFLAIRKAVLDSFHKPSSFRSVGARRNRRGPSRRFPRSIPHFKWPACLE